MYQRKRPRGLEAQLAEATFGERLMEARRIKGETIEEVSGQLRIRPSIILAMETSNFSHMPHKGYARNMVSSYARYLGLDSTRITEQFLKEFRRWESTSRLGSSSNNSNSYNYTSKRNHEPDEPILTSERKAEGREMITAAKRNRYRSTVFGNDSTKETDEAFRKQLRQNQDDQSVRQNIAAKRPPAKNPGNEPPPTHTKKLRPNDYVGKPPRRTLFSGVSRNLSRRPVILIIGLVVVFIAILILWAFLASTCANNESTLVPVTGVTAADQGLTTDQASTNAATVQQQNTEDSQYGPFELVVDVSGGSSWVQIDVDGTTPYAQVIDPPWTGTFTVSDTASIQAGAPGYVKVYRNGVEVPMDTSSGLGQLDLQVEQRPIVQNAQTADTAATGSTAADTTNADTTAADTTAQ